MMITDVDEADLVERLLRDLRATVTGDRGAYVAEDIEGYARDRAAQVREYAGDDLPYHVARVVGEVQQSLHDLFIDTTWPACPHHRRHPLWCNGDARVCEQDRVPVAHLGELASPR